MRSHNLLQELDRLDRSSPRFHDKLSNVLHREGFRQYVSNLQDDDARWLVDYLDGVCRRITLPQSLLMPP